MSLALEDPIVSTGDSLAQLTAWRFSGIDDTNTNRGRVYVDVAASGANAVVTVYSDVARSTEVATGTGAADGATRITLTASGGSGLSGSVVAHSNTASATIVLYLRLCATLDIKEYEDRASELFEEDPVETDFAVVIKQVSQAFYKAVQKRIPPPARSASPLRFPGSSPLQEEGAYGLPESVGAALWRLNTDLDWELVGLENPGDFREWAVLNALSRIWRRKVGGGSDPMLEVAQDYEKRARFEFSSVPILVDEDRDSKPERPVKIMPRRWRRA